VVKEATFANTRAAIITIKFVAVANVISAFTTFYGSIDELKHQTISLFELALEKTVKRFIQSRKMRLSTVSLSRAMKKTVLLKFWGVDAGRAGETSPIPRSTAAKLSSAAKRDCERPRENSYSSLESTNRPGTHLTHSTVPQVRHRQARRFKIVTNSDESKPLSKMIPPQAQALLLPERSRQRR